MANVKRNKYTVKKEIDFYVYIEVEASSEEEAREKANDCELRCPLEESIDVESVSFKEYYGTTDITLDKEEVQCDCCGDFVDSVEHHEMHKGKGKVCEWCASELDDEKTEMLRHQE